MPTRSGGGPGDSDIAPLSYRPSAYGNAKNRRAAARRLAALTVVTDRALVLIRCAPAGAPADWSREALAWPRDGVALFGPRSAQRGRHGGHGGIDGSGRRIARSAEDGAVVRRALRQGAQGGARPVSDRRAPGEPRHRGGGPRLRRFPPDPGRSGGGQQGLAEG